MAAWFGVVALLLATPSGAGTSTAADWLEQTGPFEVSADRLSAANRQGVYIAEGDATLRRPNLVVHADRLVFDEARQTVTAEGHVVMVEGTTVLTCSKVALKVPELVGGVASAQLRIKQGLSHATLAALPARAAARFGKDELILEAGSVQRVDARTFEIRGGSFTPCDCGDDEAPSWKIEASSADVDLDRGALLTWPVFYAKDIPVFVLPVFYVPLGERRTGFLFPRIAGSSITGVELTEPFYIAPYDSWDATIDLRYLTARGPAPALEVRWAPTKASEGWLRGTFLADFGVFDPVARSWGTDFEVDPVLRWSVVGEHVSRGPAGALAMALNLTGDPNYAGEFAGEFLERQRERSVSRLTYTYAADLLRVAAGLQLSQDLRPERYPGPTPLRQVQLFGTDDGAGDVRHRLAELRLDAAPHPLIGGVGPPYASAVLRAQGFTAPLPEQPRFARVDLRPEVAVPLTLFGGLSVEPSVALRLSGWTGRADGQAVSETRAAVVARSQVSSVAYRRFDSLVHRFSGSVDHVIVPWVGGSGPGVFDTADEIDLLSTTHQVAGTLQTDLWRQARRVALLSARLGYDLPLPDRDGEGLTELIIQAEVDAVPFDRASLRLDATAAIDLHDGTLDELLATVSFSVRELLAVGVTWGDFGSEAPRRGLIAPEELVPSATIGSGHYIDPALFRSRTESGDLDWAPWSAYRGLAVSASVTPWAPLTFRAAASFDFTAGSTVELDRDGNVIDSRSPLLAIVGAVVYTSPCDCWGATLVVGKSRDRALPDFSVLIDLARLGQVSTP